MRTLAWVWLCGAGPLLGACASANEPVEETPRPPIEDDCGSASSVGSVSIRCHPDPRVRPPAPPPAPPETRPELRCIVARGANVLYFDPAKEDAAETTKALLGAETGALAMFGSKLLACEQTKLVLHDLTTGQRTLHDRACGSLAANTSGIWIQAPKSREVARFLNEADLMTNSPSASVQLSAPEISILPDPVVFILGAGESALWTWEGLFVLTKTDVRSGGLTRIELEGNAPWVGGLHESNGIIRRMDETMRLHRYDAATGKHLGVSKRVAPGWATGFACDFVNVPINATASP